MDGPGSHTTTASQANARIEVSTRRPTSRGPYVKDAGGPLVGPVRPSDALAENLRAYRMLRLMTQDQLAARMNDLSHGWGRSTVSAVEGRTRNVTIDELFGLAVTLGVTIGELLDPTGPDNSRLVSLDVGLESGTGHPHHVAPRLAHLWAASRAVVRFFREDGARVEIELTEHPGPGRPDAADDRRAEVAQP